MLARGAVAVAGDDPAGVDVDVVMVGFHRQFDYERMRIADRRRCSRGAADRHERRRDLPDAGRPDPGRRRDPRRPSATAAGRQPVVAGKPYPADGRRRCRQLLGDVPADRLLVVGDRASTDGAFAVTLGCPFALVRSGVTAAAASRSACPSPSTPPTSPPSPIIAPGHEPG